MAGPFSTAQISRWYLLSFFFLGSLSIGMMLLIVVELQRTVSRGGEPPQTLATYARVPPPPPRSGQQPQRQHRRFRGTFSNPEVLWAQSNKVAWKHYQIAAEDGPCSCAGKKYTWDACPGPSRSLINATLQDGVFEMHCPAGVVGLYSDDIHGAGVTWKDYPGHSVKTNSSAVIARCTKGECEKFLDSLNMCPKDDLFLTQALLRPEVAFRHVKANLPLNVLVLFADSSPRADYIASLIQTQQLLQDWEVADRHTTFSFPFYNTVGQGTKRWFYAAYGRNMTTHGTVFQVQPEGRKGVPWLWEQFRSHGYATGMSFEGCWSGETEDFFGSYPYGGPTTEWGTNWNYYDELGDYTFINVFCAGSVSDGSYRRDNTQYDVELDKAPICLGGDYQSNKFYDWGFQLIHAQEQLNLNKQQIMQMQRTGHQKEEERIEAPRFKLRTDLGEVEIPSYRHKHEYQVGRDLLSPHRQPWFLHHQTMYAHGPQPCAAMQFTDLQIAKYIRRLYNHGYLNNTLLVLVSDHGFGDRVDNPFLALTLPNWLLRARPEFGLNLERNQYQLISAYDIYMTLSHLLNYPNTYHHPRFEEFRRHHDGRSPPGRSLLSEIKEYRTCDDVGVPDSHCCIGQFKVEQLDPADKTVVQQALHALEFMNNDTAPFRSECHLWTFARVLEARRVGDMEVVILQARENKGRFKAWFTGGKMVNIKQLSIWNPNKKCMPKGVVRFEFCQCIAISISED